MIFLTLGVRLLMFKRWYMVIWERLRERVLLLQGILLRERICYMGIILLMHKEKML